MVFVLVAFFVSAATIAQWAEACIPNGICGANPMCGQGILPPPPPPPIGFSPPCQRMGCGGPGMGCGPFGCYRMRAAHASTIYKPANYTRSNANPLELRAWEDLEAAAPSIAALRRAPHAQGRVDPNAAFLNCCMDRKLPDACLQKCNYNTYQRESIIGMYLKNDACPLAAVTDIQFCAAQGQDHRACCSRNGVGNTLAGPKCLIFCDQTPGRVAQLDMSYLPCFERFNEMKTCFWSAFNAYKQRGGQ
ncbi:DB domain-containing protein [Aphelenchoides fujianensis]|nr:DB domain-containing protein [Aphelenchoides fujianensis]